MALRERLQSVVRGVFECIGERRIVEHALDEEVDRPAESEARHRDVNQLTRAFADDRAAKQLLVVGTKEQLYESLEVADDLATGIGAIRRAANLVVNFLRRELFFSKSDRGDLGDGEHAI